ncbi:MAG: RNA polymerase sigma factor [Dehalococcoidia bacterium]
MTNDERNLIGRSQAGDLSAFNALVVAYQGQVYNLCLRLLGGREAAEDATQEAFIAAYRNIGRFRGGSFRAWLLRIAANVCYDELRRLRHRAVVPIDEAFDISSPDRETSPEARALQRELAWQIQAGLATLPSEQRLVVILCDVQSLSYEEAAQVIGRSVGTVKSRLSCGRARLRDYLKGQGELSPQEFRHMSEG